MPLPDHLVFCRTSKRTGEDQVDVRRWSAPHTLSRHVVLPAARPSLRRMSERSFMHRRAASNTAPPLRPPLDQRGASMCMFSMGSEPQLSRWNTSPVTNEEALSRAQAGSSWTPSPSPTRIVTWSKSLSQLVPWLGWLRGPHVPVPFFILFHSHASSSSCFPGTYVGQCRHTMGWIELPSFVPTIIRTHHQMLPFVRLRSHEGGTKKEGTNGHMDANVESGFSIEHSGANSFAAGTFGPGDAAG
ncbi:hypothetical protein F5I97DRAFT_678774 [Phlebopus sp. FC_14]|nr:hypothetical protein F5I97DRAFT_678774 [Phlebopus sp. FC_14]